MKYFFTIILFLLSVQISKAQDVQPDGPHKEYYDSGELKKEGQYKNKKRVGEWKRYYKSGQVSKIYSYDNGNYNKEEISYYESGIVSNKTEMEDGILVHFGYYENGNLKYKRQDKSGYFKSYYESGAIEIEANYLDYDLVGVWKKYYENGQLEWLVNYEEGYRQREYKHYYDNGDLKLEGFNFKDKVYGEEKRYLPNNVLEWKGEYENGLLIKTWIKYDANGEKIEKIKFKNGVATKVEFSDVLKPTKVEDGVIERVPIYPGCEEMLTNKTRKKCMNQHVNKLIGENFNTNLAVGLNLTGKQRIFIIYKIDKSGKVIEAKAKAPHPVLATEAIRVIKLLPVMKPGYQRNKPVIVPYSIPVVFQVAK